MLRLALHLLALLFSVFFALWGVLGVAGFFWVASMWGKGEDYNQSLIPVFLILSACMVATGIYGLWYMRYKGFEGLVLDEKLAWLRDRSPEANLVSGSLFMTAGLGVTAWTYLFALEKGGVVVIWHGAVIFGMTQAIYGVYQTVQARHTRRLRSAQADAQDESL